MLTTFLVDCVLHVCLDIDFALILTFSLVYVAWFGARTMPLNLLDRIIRLAV